MKKLLFATLLLASTVSASAIEWYNGVSPVGYSVKTKTAPVVSIALDMFAEDMKAVTDKRPVAGSKSVIEIYELDRCGSSVVNALKKNGVPTDRIKSEQDAFYLGVSNGKIIVAGNNGRGTAYGILELSRLAGVSPWIWWGDVVPEKKSKLTLSDDFSTCQSPSVKFRGIFINDEDWTTRRWSAETLDKGSKPGEIGPKTYKKIFQLLLRLRANAIWPAMHEGTTGFFQIPGNREIADSCGILVGGSHCEPLLRNNVAEWNEKERGRYNFITNRESVEKYWAERLDEVKGGEYFFTIGMRGIHDGSMEGVKTKEEKLNGLQAVIDSQRELIRKHFNKDVEKVPQVFIPYKEVLEIYESGLRVPDDVMLMWCDDNYGYMTRLSDAEQQKRKGGGGVYYHLSYWGRPHDYLWLTTEQPGLIYSEMRQAYDHNARNLWIANVHDPKVAAYDLSLFLDMAWNINAITPDNLQQHLASWLKTQFGDTAGERLLPVMTEFYRLCGIRKPEFMGWTQVELDKKLHPRGRSQVIDTEFSTAFGNELNRYLEDYHRIVAAVSDIEKTIRPELRDAFFAHIKYPVECAAAMADKMLEAQKARQACMGETGMKLFTRKTDALTYASRSMAAYYKIRSLSEYYNKVMAGGKWNGDMDFMPRDLNVFNAPLLPIAPLPEEMEKYNVPDNNHYPITTEGTIVRNACDYTLATDGAKAIQMLGHSMKAVSVPKGGKLTYEVTLDKAISGILHTAVIPTQANDKGDIRYSVSIDGGKPTVYSLKEPYRSERWKLNVMRGQALRTLDVDLSAGKHTITISALDDHIIIDQWMLDSKKDRKFYVFPVKSAL